ncbi:MAG: hypothetical protein J6R26_00975 [Paludibacteraceae bacterium]|nr:hypothetical protein [Paludibacteraceae bacterium]
MAQISFDNNNTSVNEVIENTQVLLEDPTLDEPTNVEITPEHYTPESKSIAGLSSEELNDPNKISVTIADKDAPIVVLFGPPACGKTMTLVRMTRFLSEQGYTIEPVRTFRPSYDSNYSDLCENFDTMINQDNAAESTDRISFMLVKVIKNGKTICQLLEAPGEYYFNPKVPNSPFPRFFNAIKACRCRKIWTIMVEPNWQNESDRLNYVNRIKKLRVQMTNKDRAIIIYNKIDKTQFLIDGNGNAHMGAARKDIHDLYPGIFEPFRNTTPILSMFTPFNCDFTIFQTGDYSQANDGTNIFEAGADVFPRRLWKIIMKHVRG